MLYKEGTKTELKTGIISYLNSKSGTLLGEPEVLEVKMYYPRCTCVFIIGACFTIKPIYIIALINSDNDAGDSYIIEGKLNPNDFMCYATRIVMSKFNELTYREQRRILLDFGNQFSAMLAKFDGTLSSDILDNGISMTIMDNKYDIFTDIDWIEDIMDGKKGRDQL